jgi:hypothetical protein
MEQETGLNQIKTIVENSKSLAILLEKNPEDYEIFNREVLKSVFISKNIPTISLPSTDEGFRNKWSSLIRKKQEIPLPIETSLKIPKEKCLIKEVSYNEDENYLSFILTSLDKKPSKEDIELKTMPPRPSMVFCLFKERQILEEFHNQLQLPEKEKIIFLYAEEKLLTEKVFAVLKTLKPDLLSDPEICTLLFGSLALETNNFSEGINQSILSLASILLKNGADKKTFFDVLEKEKSPFFVQIIGRLLARTYIDEVLKNSWSFLNLRDLQKTNNLNAGPDYLYRLLKKIKPFLPAQKLHVLIWQNFKEIKAMICEGALKGDYDLFSLAEKMQAELKSPFFVIGPFKNFSQAELYIREQIKEKIEEKKTLTS